MEWTLAGALTTLRHEVDAAFPIRSKVSDGTLGDTAHAARKSDHNPDARNVVRAWDCTRDVVDGIDVAEYLAEWLRAKRDPRVKYLIFRRRICASYPVGGIAPWGWRPYDGLNAHEHHLHISVQPYPVGDDAAPWGFTLTPPAPPEEDMPTADEIAKAVWEYPVDRKETANPKDTIPAGEALSYSGRFSYMGLENDKADTARDAVEAAAVTALTGRVVGLEQGQNTILTELQALAAKIDAALAPPPAGG